MRKQPRARVREGRPSSALGDLDHRSRKVAVARPNVPRAQMDEIELTGSETDAQRRLIEGFNLLVREHNEED